MKTIDMRSEYLEMMRQILRKHLPENAIIWVFGSRATGTAKEFSDVDLAIDRGEVLSLDILASLAYDFEESNLPYKVDIVDWANIDDSFRAKIKASGILLKVG